MSSKPTISVLMPFRNCEKYLEEAINSVLCQTFEDFELIAINDNSTDQSWAIASRLSQKDSRINLIDSPERGLVENLNYGIKLCNGEYIARMDGDDVCLPHRLEKTLEYLSQRPDVAVVGAQHELIDHKSRKIIKWRVPLQHKEIDQSHLLKIQSAMNNPTTLIRKSALIQLGGYMPDMRYAEDFDLWLRMAEIGTLANLPDYLLLYRQHLTSIGFSKLHTQFKFAIQASKNAHQRRGLKFDSLQEPDFKQPSRAEIYEKWAWWAIIGSNYRTASVYALKVIMRRPIKSAGWKILFCAMRGR